MTTIGIMARKKNFMNKEERLGKDLSDNAQGLTFRNMARNNPSVDNVNLVFFDPRDVDLINNMIRKAYIWPKDKMFKDGKGVLWEIHYNVSLPLYIYDRFFGKSQHAFQVRRKIINKVQPTKLLILSGNKLNWYDFCMKNNITAPGTNDISKIMEWNNFPNKKVLKPTNGSMGRNIITIGANSSVSKYLKYCSKDYIVQEYINPIKYDGKATDIRVFMQSDSKEIITTLYASRIAKDKNEIRTNLCCGGSFINSEETYSKSIIDKVLSTAKEIFYKVSREIFATDRLIYELSVDFIVKNNTKRIYCIEINSKPNKGIIYRNIWNDKSIEIQTNIVKYMENIL